MAKQCNHYDVAFEKLLRLVRRPYVSVNETRRALHGDESLKSMDFVVYSQTASNLLIDVKGRRSFGGRPSWQNWAMQDDIDSLLKWEEVFGDGFRSVLVFAYEVLEASEMDYHPVTWEFQRRRYAFYGVWTREYAQKMRLRSRSWKTVFLGANHFQELRQPILSML
ncbi:HYExAFE family protein [Thalassoglobus sp. JC818]|uniref:HYExAFE family protein n=1 Tax=Thalassoglobus sp. JC818 TaxID=3232136 RepID=UPI00345A6643